LAFFIAGQLTSFFTAVGVLMGTTLAAVIISWLAARHIPWLPILSAVLVLAGGAVTLVYQAPDAIIVADTVYYILLTIGFSYSLYHRVFILKRLFAPVFAITDEGWQRLTRRWLWLVLLAAVANEIARASISPELWIEYRFYKSIVILFFALWQFTLTRRYRIAAESNAWGLRR